MNNWLVVLNGVGVATCDTQDEWDDTDCFPLEIIDCLTEPPDGLGLPELRTEDVTYFQRDGVKHFSDWYNPRTITLVGTIGPVDACSCSFGNESGGGYGDGLYGDGLYGGGSEIQRCDCLTARGLLSDLVQAWKRGCCDTELVIYPPCPPGQNSDERALTGPFGVIGRPRVMQYKWLYRDQQVANVVMRFDAVDHRMYVLDECGTPGYTSCVEIQPGTLLMSRCYDRCYTGGTRCYSTPVTSDDSVPPEDVAVGGTEKVNPEIVLYPPLTMPYVENITNGEYIQYDGTLTDDDSPVTINTEDGTAFDAEGNSLTHLLRGSLFMSMFPGNYEWRLLSTGDETGYAQLCWRDTVVMA